MAGGAIRSAVFFPGARKTATPPSGMGKERSKFVFRERSIQPAQLHRNVVEPAWCKAAIEMPQSGNDHPDDGDLHVGPGLIEDEEIETRALGDLDAGEY